MWNGSYAATVSPLASVSEEKKGQRGQRTANIAEGDVIYACQVSRRDIPQAVHRTHRSNRGRHVVVGLHIGSILVLKTWTAVGRE